MQKKSLTILFCVLFLLGLFIGIMAGSQARQKKDSNNHFKIVTSFYPIYVMTANLTEGANNIELTNMTDTHVGCLHDYTLTTRDMKKIENADILVENGLGLENFNEKIVNAYPYLTVIDSSKTIPEKIYEEEEKINPHIWSSINNYISQVNEISKNLILINSENEAIYSQNVKNYLESLQTLKEQYDRELTSLKGKRGICLNEALVYLLSEIGLDTMVVETDHEESTLSAEMMKTLIQTMKEKEIKAIFVDEEDNLKNAQMLAEETGAEIYKLNSGLTGEVSKDAYLNAMKENLEVLKTLR